MKWLLGLTVSNLIKEREFIYEKYIYAKKRRNRS